MSRNNNLDNDNNDTTRLSNDDLWEKSGTSQPITKADIGLNNVGDESGLRKVREGLKILKYSDGNG